MSIENGKWYKDIYGVGAKTAEDMRRKLIHGLHQMTGEFSYVLTDARDPFDPMKTLANTGGMPALIRSCSSFP